MIHLTSRYKKYKRKGYRFLIMTKPIAVLGLHKDPWHNTGAALIVEQYDQAEVFFVSEERLDRKKDSRAFPQMAIEACLREAGISGHDQLDLIVMDYIVNGSDWQQDYHAKPCRTDVWLNEVDSSKIRIINHHLAHAAVAYYASGYQESAILVVDGRGSDLETQSLFAGQGNRIELLEGSDTIGIGLLYASVTQLIGFGLLQEGKTMGLAPFGALVPPSLPVPLLPIHGKVLGVAADFSDLCIEGSYDLRVPIDVSTPERKARAAFEVQDACELEMLRLARYAKAQTNSHRLCISGGVGLNSVANYQIYQAKIFDDLYIPPACSDSGIPLGAALWGYHGLLGRPLRQTSLSPFLGPRYSEAEIQAAVAACAGLDVVPGPGSLEAAASLLAQNFILGCFQGRSEAGPRALGNRSILMSPLLAGNQDVLNARVKFRESFRPFAPACMEEHAREYFEIDCPSPYMLLVPKVRPEKRGVIPAVTHVDGTGRLQTLTAELNPVFYQLASMFKDRTGVPVLLNTSFNVNGEPIVETPADAVRCFLGTNIDALLIGDHLVLKPHAASALGR